MTHKIRRAWLNRAGVTAVEYGLIAALISVAVIGGATLLGADIGGLFESTETTVEDATTPQN